VISMAAKCTNRLRVFVNCVLIISSTVVVSLQNSYSKRTLLSLPNIKYNWAIVRFSALAEVHPFSRASFKFRDSFSSFSESKHFSSLSLLFVFPASDLFAFAAVFCFGGEPSVESVSVKFSVLFESFLDYLYVAINL